AQSGQLELNPFVPLLADAFLHALSLLEAADRVFAERCVDGLVVDAARVAAPLGGAGAVATALVGTLGHDGAAEVAEAAPR
ncbi:aspartate ammonia-lyase, partial [Mycobacterium tuberculosis]|nr:aspartate ammonia-lyase [Mycobacterium tuberculosis]